MTKLVLLLVVMLAPNWAWSKKPLQTTIAEQAQAVLVVDRQSGRIIEGFNYTSQLPIASITKLMTVYVVLESNANLDEPIIIKRQKIEGSRNLLPGMHVSRRELIMLSLVASDNLAAKTLALAHPQGYDEFVSTMNLTAARLGMINTVYVEPTGLLLNKSTAWDLHLLNNAVIKHKEFTQAAMTAHTTTNATNVAGIVKHIMIRNTSIFAGKYNITVGKTGFTNPAGWCMSMQVVHNGKEFDIIVLGSPNKKIRNELISAKLQDYMNSITANAIIKDLAVLDQ